MTAKTSTKPAAEAVVRRQIEGTVVSVAENKTARVSVKTVKTHAKYQKQFYTTKKYAVHDEKNEAKVGDTIIFEECRPLSKMKRWRLIRVK